MADIDVQRRSGMTWLWVLLGLIVLALIIWAIAANDDERVAMEPVTEQPITPPATEMQPTAPLGAAPERAAEAAGVPIPQIMESPATWTGRTITGEVRVVEVPTDRGFWIEDQGERLFAILIDQPAEQPKDINPGQTLRLEQATLRDSTYLASLPGEPLDADTRRIVEGLPVFLVVDEANIDIQGQPSLGRE